MDEIWERWDLACDPVDGCDRFDQILRLIVWAYFFIAIGVVFMALQPWARSIRTLPRIVADAAAAIGAFFLALLARSWVASSGSLRLAAVLTAIALAAVVIGRPSFLDRPRSRSATNRLPPGTEAGNAAGARAAQPGPRMDDDRLDHRSP